MKNYYHLGGGNGLFFEIHTTKNVGGFSPLCVSGLTIFLKKKFIYPQYPCEEIKT